MGEGRNNWSRWLRIAVAGALLPWACSLEKPSDSETPTAIRCIDDTNCPEGLSCVLGSCQSLTDGDSDGMMGDGSGDSAGDSMGDGMGDSSGDGMMGDSSGDSMGDGDGDTDPVSNCTDCTGLQVCDEMNSMCLEPSVCVSNFDCLGMRECDRGRCVDATGDECVDSTDCQQGDICDTGTCSTCIDDVDCGGNQICDTGTCQEPTVCDAGADCIGGRECDVNCGILSTAGCTGSLCGNNMIDPGELCDGTAFAVGDDCGDIGLAGPADDVTCSDDCQRYEYTFCTPPTCGDGIIAGNEICDDDSMSMTPTPVFAAPVASGNCTDVPFRGYTGGTLTCSACVTLGEESCTPSVGGSCGDDTKDAGELCDGMDVGTATCADFGFGGGTLACGGTCEDRSCIVDPFEPNNVAADVQVADAITDSQVISGSVELCSSDSDWFLVRLNEGDGYVVRFEFPRSYGDLVWTIYDVQDVANLSDDITLATNTGFPGIDVAQITSTPSADTYLEILNLSSQTIPLDMEFVVFPGGFCLEDSQEPNDALSDAFTIQDPADFALNATVCPSEDDYFVFDIPDGQSVDINLAASSGPSYDARLYQGSLENLVVRDNRPLASKDLVHLNDTGATQQYILQLRSESTTEESVVLLTDND